MKKISKFISNYTVPLKGTKLKIILTIHSMDESLLIKQTDISDKLGVPNTTLNYHFTKLREWGLIDKQNKLTDKCKRILRYWKQWDKDLGVKLRAHKIQIVIYLSKLPKNFEDIQGYMFTPFSNNRYSGLKTEVLGSKVMFYGGKKAVVKIPDVYGNDDEEIMMAITEFITQIIQVLKSEFNGLKVDSYKPARYSCMHVAILDSIIAESYIVKHKHNYSNRGIAVDKSHGRYELEAESPKNSLEDIEVLVGYEDLEKEKKRFKDEVNKYESPKK
ncbi:hypothetical protein HOF78_01835 [Candidatus Woesearchaeota archaeon]|jgi:DNA-binding MarR family transcriptional regulator|nr:hypothetical protein [Candidatus Woesearchaeota archaeon]